MNSALLNSVRGAPPGGPQCHCREETGNGLDEWKKKTVNEHKCFIVKMVCFVAT